MYEFHRLSKTWQKKYLDDLHKRLDHDTAIIEIDKMKSILLALNVQKPKEKEHISPFCLTLIVKGDDGELDLTYFIEIPDVKGDLPILINGSVKKILQKPEFQRKFGQRSVLHVTKSTNGKY